MADDGRCFDWDQRSTLSAQRSAPKPGVSGTWRIRWMQKPRLTIFRVAVRADSAARRQQPLGCRYQNSIYPTYLSSFRLYNPSCVAVSRSQCRDWLVVIEYATASRATKHVFNSRAKACSKCRDAKRQRSTRSICFVKTMRERSQARKAVVGRNLDHRRPSTRRWAIHRSEVWMRLLGKFALFFMTSLVNNDST